ncbi:MAG: phosphate acetyltransferase [Firmicutes bacterium]|nr:phosphate acetyltransferase [Bacillota bacterium]
MNLMENVRKKAKANPGRVAFPEANDLKMLKAMNEVCINGYCTVVVVGNIEEVNKLCAENNIDSSKWEFIDLNNEEYKENVLRKYLKLPNIIYGEKSLRRRLNDPLYLALMMQAIDEVDVTFAGITSTSGDFVLASQTIIGLKDNLDVVSSVGIAELPNYKFFDGGNLIAVGDCAVCPNPSASELASIAIATCETIKAVTDWEPRCALLSYSTDGSGQGQLVDKVKTAVKIANEKRPDLKIDGEFQLDSAIVPEIALKKVKRPSAVAGQANILIFPDLNAGNIGVKLIQQFGGANAYGPLLQGFKKICSDCSRSAPVEELVGNILFSIVRAGDLKNGK